MMRHRARLAELAADSRAKSDQGKRAERHAELGKKFARNGPYAFAPADQRRDSERELDRDLDREQAEALYRLRAYALEHRPELEAAIIAARTAPDCEQAHELRTGHKGGNLEECYARALLAEAYRARFDRELSSELPSRVLRLYHRALSDPTAQENASLIGWVERKHGEQWSGPASSEPSELASLSALRSLITDTQAARVPAELLEVRASFAEAGKLISTLEAIGVRAVKPAEGEGEE